MSFKDLFGKPTIDKDLSERWNRLNKDYLQSLVSPSSLWPPPGLMDTQITKTKVIIELTKNGYTVQLHGDTWVAKDVDDLMEVLKEVLVVNKLTNS